MRYDTENGAQFLVDDYEVSFAPSLSLLLRLSSKEDDARQPERNTSETGEDWIYYNTSSRRREKSDEYRFSRGEPLDLLVVANPTGDLSWSADEAGKIAGFFDGSCCVLSGAEATRDAFFEVAPRAKVLHLCCHGTFDRKNPWKSSLILADERDDSTGEYIQLDEIFSRISFSRIRLAVLSACETGLVDTDGRSDEFVGLPGGFLRGGAMCVVASLWSVDDRATAALMTRFYHGIAVEGRPPAEALKLAQIHIRANRQWRSPYFWGAFRALGISG